MAAVTVGRIDIPEQYRGGLFALATLPDSAFDELQAALKNAPEVKSRKELVAWITPEAKSVAASEIPAIIDALASLYRVSVSVKVSIERLSSDVTAALADIPQAALKLPEEKRAAFQTRLTQLLKISSLDVAETKAGELKSEFERSFCDCRILTDLRPVFGKNISESPATMLIAHTLKLGYHDVDKGKHREFYVTLDMADLASLKDAIIRAETKEKTLKSQLQAMGVKPVEAE